jgi:hypothetical protein
MLGSYHPRHDSRHLLHRGRCGIHSSIENVWCYCVPRRDVELARDPSRSKSSPKGDEVSKVKSKRVGENELVLTPGGWRLKSKTFKLEPGQHVAVQEGKLRVIRTATGEVVADLGPVRKGTAAKGGPRGPNRPKPA